MATLKQTRSTAKRKRPQAAEPGSRPSPDEEINLNLNCWIRKMGQDSFGVKIKKSETVDSLKLEILKQIGGEHVSKSWLTVWKVQVQLPERNIVETGDNCSLDEVGERLVPSHRLSTIFIEEPAEYHIHIIACISPPEGTHKHSKERTDGIPPAVKRLKTELG